MGGLSWREGRCRRENQTPHKEARRHFCYGTGVALLRVTPIALDVSKNYVADFILVDLGRVERVPIVAATTEA